MIAFITGATAGIGKATAEIFAKNGYNIIITGRRKERLDEFSSHLKSTYKVDVLTLNFDVRKLKEVETAVNSIPAEWKNIDVLVNNAGITKDGAFRKMTPENWHAVISTNLDSVFNCTRHVINPMIEKGFGRVINISSVNGQRGQFGQANYSAAKAGMHGFTKTLAMEVANKGVTVNTISPGYIGTDMVMAVKEEIRNQIIAQIPMGRLGGTEEVAYLVSFLASEHASFITGANLSINGGQHVY